MSGRNKTNVWLQLHNALNANLYDRAEQIVEQIVDSSQGPIPPAVSGASSGGVAPRLRSALL